MKRIVVVGYGAVVKLNETQLEVNMKVNGVVVQMKMKEMFGRNEDWEKDTCKGNLWTVNLGNRCTAEEVTGDRRIMVVAERKDGTCICDYKDKTETANTKKGDEDEDGCDIDWGKNMIKETDGLLIGGDGVLCLAILVQMVLLMVIKLI